MITLRGNSSWDACIFIIEDDYLVLDTPLCRTRRIMLTPFGK
jgi:hypothetical protein